MKRGTVVVAIGSVLAGVAVAVWTSPSQVASAQSVIALPKAYGSLRAANADYMFLEDSTGTIRLIDRGGTLVRTFPRN
jgi:hypothetical protein